MKKLINLLAASIFLLPALYLVKFNFFSGTINLLDLLLFFFIICSVLLIKKQSWQKFVAYARKNCVTIALVSFLMLALFISFFANIGNLDWTSALGIIKSFFALPILFSILLVFLIQEKIASFEKILVYYFYYGSALSFAGIVFYLLGILTFDHRLTLIFQSPNQLAISLSPALLIGIYFIRYKKGLIHKYFGNLTLFMVFFLPIFFSLLATKSAGALIGVLAAATVLLFDNLKTRKTMTVLVFVLCIASIIFIGNSGFFLKKSGYQNQIPPNSTDSRLAIYQADEKILKDNWFWGIGPSNFQNKYLEYQKYFPPYPQWAVPHGHNVFIHIWIETGLLGFLAFFLIIWLGLKKIFYLSNQKPAILLAGAIFIYFVVHGLWDVSLWKNDLALVFWFFLYATLTVQFDSEKIAT